MAIEVVRLRWVAVLLVGMTIQLFAGLTSTPPALLVSSMLLIAAFLFANRARAGFPLALLGLVLNVLVIAANSGMPVSENALVRSGLELSALDQRHVASGAETHLNFLGDVIPVAGKVLSIGDVLMALGLLLFLIGSVGQLRSGSVAKKETAEFSELDGACAR